MPEDNPEIWRDMNPQQIIYNAINRAMAARARDPNHFKSHVAAVWNSLFPRLKRKLSERIGDKEFNERWFEDLYKEVEPEESEALGINDHEIWVCERIFNEILLLLEKEGLLYDVDSRMRGHD